MPIHDVPTKSLLIQDGGAHGQLKKLGQFAAWLDQGICEGLYSHGKTYALFIFFAISQLFK